MPIIKYTGSSKLWRIHCPITRHANAELWYIITQIRCACTCARRSSARRRMCIEFAAYVMRLDLKYSTRSVIIILCLTALGGREHTHVCMSLLSTPIPLQCARTPARQHARRHARTGGAFRKIGLRNVYSTLWA